MNNDYTLEDLLKDYPKWKHGLDGSEYIIRIQHDFHGLLHIYVRPSDRDGDTLDFFVNENQLIPYHSMEEANGLLRMIKLKRIIKKI